jgi:protease-4
MTIDSEMLLERRKVRGKLLTWRVAAVVLGILLILVLVIQDEKQGSPFGKDQIARVQVAGMILDDKKQQKLLQELADNKRVKAVLLDINSPGGTTTGGEALYLSIREVAKKKPVVAVFGTVAASAAYMAGLGADHIVTRGSTITGSVGVLMQWPDVTDLMGKVGVTMEELKSGRLKATPSPFRRDDPANLAPMRELVQDMFDWFVGLVEERRKLDPASVPGLVEGRVYTGRRAVELGLADAIGGQDEAVAWLEKEKKLEKDLPVVEHEPRKDLSASLFSSALSQFGGWLGIDWLSRLSPLASPFNSGVQQGLMSVWAPAGMKQ